MTTAADAYLTVEEFAALTSDEHHAVWRAAMEGRVQWVPYAAKTPTGHRRYHREQVRALLRELETAR